MATLIKIDRNGSKHWKGLVTCDRCDGRGWYAVGVHNDHLVPSSVDDAVCYKCHGKGKVMSTWIERTPEYQAKLDAKREAKWVAIKAEQERIAKEREEREAAEEKAMAEAEAARKAISQYVGEVGKKVELQVTFEYEAEYQTKFGWTSVFGFKDANGNKIVWKTSSVPMVLDKDGNDVTIGKGDKVTIKGTVKEHSEYREEKQTILTRCKLFVGA